MQSPGVMRSLAVRLTLAAALGSALVTQARAQQATPTPQQDSSAAAADNNGDDFTKPENLLQLRYRYMTAPGSGGANGTNRAVTTDTLYVRMDYTFDLPSQWKLVLRGDLPFVSKDPISADNPAGNYLLGLGDADAQAALIDQLNARWAAGAGFRLIAPTGPDNITSGKWQAMPIIGARAALPELSDGSSFTGIVRYDISFAGDPTKRNISNLQLEPMLNIGLPDKWFFTLYPSADIRINYGDPVTGQTGRLFLPFDFSVGRSVAKNTVVSLEIGVPIVKEYPVYDFKSIARLNLKF